MKPDARGWLWHEKVKMIVGYHAFMRIADCYVALRFVCRRLGLKRWPQLIDSRKAMTLASWGYLYSDWRQHDMPEHERVGGIWR